MAKTIVMHRNRKGQFVKGRASNPKKKHAGGGRRRKRNYVIAGGAVPMVNPKHHRRRKHNPSVPIPGVGSVEFPIDTVIGVTAGLAGPPLVQGFATPLMPQTAAQYPTAMMIGSNLAVLGGAYLIFGRKAARDVLVGEVAGFLVKQIQSIAATSALSLQGPAYSAARTMGGYTRGVPYQQLRGYTGPVPRGQLGRAAHHGRGRGMLRGLQGGIGQINQRISGTRFQSRLTSR